MVGNLFTTASCDFGREPHPQLKQTDAHDIHPYYIYSFPVPEYGSDVRIMCLPENKNRGEFGIGFRRKKGSLGVGS